MAEKDRQDLIDAFKREPAPDLEEIAKLFNEGSVGSQLLGKLFREQAEAETPFLSIDLVSEEGRLRAIQTQGRISGRSEILNTILDLIMEGSQDDRPEQQ